MSHVEICLHYFIYYFTPANYTILVKYKQNLAGGYFVKRIIGVVLAFVMVLSFFSTPASAAIDESELNAYLQEVSAERGWTTLTAEEFNDYLNTYSLMEDGVNEFDTLDEMKEYLGEVILADLSNIEPLNEFHETDIVKLLEENDDSVENYLYLDDLDFAVMEYIGYDWEDEEMFDEEFLSFLADTFGLTGEEIDRLVAHMEMLDEELSKPENEAKLEEIALRMMEFEEFESVKELSDDQVAELLYLTKELMTMLQLDAEIYLLDEAGKETAISFKDLMFMEDMKGYSVLIELYSAADGEFLADFILTADMFNSEIITDTGKEIKETPAAGNTKPAKTVNGAKLPKTAGYHADYIILGAGMLALGLWVRRRAISVK
jgi:processed acidic surface protein